MIYDKHVMTVEHDGTITRYRCPECGRCVEDRADGLHIINKGDQMARHVGGVFAEQLSMEIKAGEPERPPTLH